MFSQFDGDGNGHYERMEHPNIDTGMGLERLACIMQGVDNLFLVDTVQNIMKHICRIAGIQYGEDEKKDISLRVITDHIRSTTFMIGDGVMPSNEGRGYVLRRLLRRAARHGRLLGINHTFLADVANTVIDENKNAYPELDEKRAMITKLIHVEEESFAKTIDQGMQMLNSLIDKDFNACLSGEDAFRLNDTYGFPLDLTKEIVAERGMTVDEERFHQLMQEQRERARNARKNAGADAWAGENDVLADVPPTEFLGYEKSQAEATVLAILKDGERVDHATAGDEIALVLDRTTFYAESGGQVGDVGPISSADALIAIDNTTKNHAKNFIHHGVINAGTISVGDRVQTEGDPENHRAIMRNHTAAHLLQAALRTVLGDHVHQAGSLVEEDRLRFDFTHFSALTAEELAKVSAMVNEAVLEGYDIHTDVLPIEEAKKKGAIALFGEKYGDTVRVVDMGEGYSVEFCGGTHLDNTAKVGVFHISSEFSVASGVRRIEATTGQASLDVMNRNQEMLFQAAAALKAKPGELREKAEQTMLEVKTLHQMVEKFKAKESAGEADRFLFGARQVGELKVLTATIADADANKLRQMGDMLRDKAPNVVAVLATVNGEKITFLAVCGKEAVAKGIKAGEIIKNVTAICGGKGGGKPDSAMGGGTNVLKLDDALASMDDFVAEKLN